MNEPTPTPETDAAEHFFTDIDGVTQAVVDSDFARNLERQRNEAHQQIEAVAHLLGLGLKGLFYTPDLAVALKARIELTDTFRKERDEARRERDRMHTERDAVLENAMKLSKERDAALASVKSLQIQHGTCTVCGYVAWLERGKRQDCQYCEAIARVKELEGAVDRLARLGNEPFFGNSDGNTIARAALAKGDK